MSKAKSTMAANESAYASRPWLKHYNFWTPPHMNYPRRPLHEILRITASEVPDQPATAFLGQHLTFIQLRDLADRFATALSRLGIKQGDRVGIMLPNCPQYVIAAFAIFRLGATVVNVNPIYPSDAAAQGIGGVVILRATIDIDGTVRDVQTLRSVNDSLTYSAANAMNGWEFTPTLLNGVAVPVRMTATFNFENK